MKHYILEQVELIESEFPNVVDEELYDMVWDILSYTNPRKYQRMNEYDKFDYLVDNVINMMMEREVSRLEKQTNAECR